MMKKKTKYQVSMQNRYQTSSTDSSVVGGASQILFQLTLVDTFVIERLSYSKRESTCRMQVRQQPCVAANVQGQIEPEVERLTGAGFCKAPAVAEGDAELGVARINGE